MNIKNKRTLSGIGMAALFATGGAGNLFTAVILMSVALPCLFFGKAFSEETWK